LTGIPVQDWSSVRSWELVLPPNRPGAEVLATLRRCLQRLGSIRHAAVLGATPEFVDLLTHAGAEAIVCIDRCPEFATSMRSLRSTPASETLAVGEWRDVLSAFPGAFDVILSDFTLGNLPYGEQGELLDAVAGALAPRGRFLDRVLTYRQPCHPYERLIEEFRRLPANLVTLNDFNARWLFCGERVTEHEVVDPAETYAWSRAAFGGAGIDWLVDNCARLSPPGLCWHYGRPWSEVRAVYATALVIEAEHPEPSASAYRDWAYVIQSRARGAADDGGLR
jgi:hypothetical protein